MKYITVWKSIILNTAYVSMTVKNPEERWNYTWANKHTVKMHKRLYKDLLSSEESDWERTSIGPFNNFVELCVAEQNEAKRLENEGVKLYKNSHGNIVINQSLCLSIQKLIECVDEARSKGIV